MKTSIYTILTIILLGGCFLFAEGPVYQHKDPIMQIEFENVYQDLRKKTPLTEFSVSGGTITRTDPSINALYVNSTGVGGTEPTPGVVNIMHNVGNGDALQLMLGGIVDGIDVDHHGSGCSMGVDTYGGGRGLRIQAHSSTSTVTVVQIDNAGLAQSLYVSSGTGQINGQWIVQYGTITMLVGADSLSNTLTDATNKDVRIGLPHYTNAEEPVALINGQSAVNSNTISIGGNSSILNSATRINLIVAADNVTTTGTTELRVEISTTQVFNNFKVNTGYFEMYDRTRAQLRAITPGKTGQQYNCTDCTATPVCISTGVAINSFSSLSSKTTACQ